VHIVAYTMLCASLQVAEAIGVTCPWASHFRVTSARASAAAVEYSAARMSLLYSVTHSRHAARVLLNSTAAAGVSVSGGCCDGTACGSSKQQQQQQQQCLSTGVDDSAETAPLDSVNSSVNSSSDALESSMVILPTADISHNTSSSSSSEECPELLVPEPADTIDSSDTAADVVTPSSNSSRHTTSAVSSGRTLTQQLRSGVSTTSTNSSSGSSSVWMNFGLWRRRPCGGIPTYTQVYILANQD
jgi:hypothetical protein